MKKIIMILSFMVSLLMANENNSLVKFPQNYINDIQYFQMDRGSVTEVMYVNKEAIIQLKKNNVLPSGTVITLVEYFKNTNDINRYVVMEKRTGWGKNRDSSTYTGEWEFQVFNADKSIKTTDDVKRCQSCHNSEKESDYLFTLSEIHKYKLLNP